MCIRDRIMGHELDGREPAVHLHDIGAAAGQMGARQTRVCAAAFVAAMAACRRVAAAIGGNAAALPGGSRAASGDEFPSQGHRAESLSGSWPPEAGSEASPD